ncbi:hypothetical protein [Azospirillum isscasi]|uniref:Uncharacterized protein n=1 Tax=Azospirillum isscasi TaxID=3053926 RepID=A0ABU0WMF6_9PROT|nr:hypothetical protein [Azospirillum isscasi]MDQ2105007.1 hypothetical protein [Azospirillum isscasi]
MTVMSIAQGVRNTPPGHRFASATQPADQGFSAVPADAAAPSREAGTFQPADGAAGRAVDGAAGKTFRVDAFAGVLKQKTAAFNEELAVRFALADMDTRQPVTLDVDAEGRVTVAGDHPGKAAIERLFAEDPEFANRYREIAGGHAFLAHCRVATRFQHELEDSKTEEERKTVLRRYESVFRQLEAAGGRMAWAGGPPGSAAVDMASRLLGLPSWAMG